MYTTTTILFNDKGYARIGKARGGRRDSYGRHYLELVDGNAVYDCDVITRLNTRQVWLLSRLSEEAKGFLTPWEAKARLGLN